MKMYLFELKDGEKVVGHALETFRKYLTRGNPYEKTSPYLYDTHLVGEIILSKQTANLIKGLTLLGRIRSPIVAEPSTTSCELLRPLEEIITKCIQLSKK